MIWVMIVIVYQNFAYTTIYCPRTQEVINSEQVGDPLLTCVYEIAV